MVKSRPVWGAWIEIWRADGQKYQYSRSRPVWGAWIEIFLTGFVIAPTLVAPRMGRVD